MNNQKPKIVAIVGPTASGKSNLGVELAERFKGEVISCDSRQVYRGLDLGTGKITIAERREVPHHLLDVVSPHEIYTVADYVSDAKRAIHRTLERDNLPIIVGGSFMYLDSLLGHISLPPVPPNPILRSELATLNTTELVGRLKQLDPDTAQRIDHHNNRRLIRAIEIATLLGHVPPVLEKTNFSTLLIGIKIDRATLRKNIEQRLKSRLAAGLVKEVSGLLESGLTHERLESFGLEYRYVSRHLRGEMTEAEMTMTLITKIYQYAKRQETWLKRYASIKWFSYPVDSAAVAIVVDEFLSSTSLN